MKLVLTVLVYDKTCGTEIKKETNFKHCYEKTFPMSSIIYGMGTKWRLANKFYPARRQ